MTFRLTTLKLVKSGVGPRLLVICLIAFVIALQGCVRKAPVPAGVQSRLPSGPLTLKAAAAPRGIHIGAAACSRCLGDPGYSQILGAEFSQLEPENDMKFALIHPRPNTDPQPYDFSAADGLVSFAQAHGMLVRGHTLVWHNQIPRWLTNTGYSPSQLAEVLHDHIQTVVAHFGNSVYAWDVVNEAYNDDGTMRHTLWYDQPGIGFAGEGTRYIEQALAWARAANPSAKLFYNDYDAEAVNAKSDAIYAMAADFRKRGVPLDGIGFQAHLDQAFDNPETLASFRSNLKRFAELGLEIHITELDIRLRDSTPASLDREAQLYAKIVDLCLEFPACKVVQTWGVSDNYSWIPSRYPGQGWALLWSTEYQKKPAYWAVLERLSRH